MEPLRRHAERHALRQLDGVYRGAEALYQGWGCARSGDCCQLAKAGHEPYVWPVEWLRVREALHRQGRPAPPPRPDGACRLLNQQGGCSVYADRPLGCRTFYCGRGFGPRAVSREEITGLMVRLQRVALELDPEAGAPQPLASRLDELTPG